MKFDEGKIEKITLNFVGFNKEPSAVIGRVVMPISIQGKIVYSTMMVVDTDSDYNAILWRAWLNEMKAVILTFQQNIKFPNKNKVVTLKCEHKVAQSCYVEATKRKFTAI